MRIHWILLVALISIVLWSCGNPAGAVDQSPELATLIPQEISTSTPSFNISESPVQSTDTPETLDMITPEAGKDKLVDLVKQDLADRLKINLAKISLVKTMDIKSPDISAGCNPQAGQIITQGGQVYGYRIWLEAVGQEYIYHAGLSGEIVFCPKFTPGANNPLLTTPSGSNQDYQNQSP